MAKRFTDTTKYKKPFFRSLPGAYKLLWDFLYHDCDHAGIWIVDFDVAQIYLGSDMPVTKAKALDLFNSDDSRIIEIDNGKKWFIPSFIEFQYGKLKQENRAHINVISILSFHGLIDSNFYLTKNKPLASPLQGAKEKEKEQEQFKEQEKEKGGEFKINKSSDWIRWGSLIVNESDAQWEGMRGRKVSQAEMDSFLSVATRNGWVMDSQNDFRISLKGFKSSVIPSAQNGVNQQERMKNL